MKKHKKIAPPRLEVISKNGVIVGSKKLTKEGLDFNVLKRDKENEITVSEKLIFSWINPYV